MSRYRNRCCMPRCTNEHHSRGLCNTHYQQVRREGDLDLFTAAADLRRETCRGPECDRAARTKGLCNAHYMQESRGKPLTPLRVRSVGRRARPSGRKYDSVRLANPTPNRGRVLNLWNENEHAKALHAPAVRVEFDRPVLDPTDDDLVAAYEEELNESLNEALSQG